MHNRMIGFVVVLAATGFGCGLGGTSYTCTFGATYGVCWEWDAPVPPPSSQVTQLQNACTSGVGVTGTFSSGASCPSANRVGTCTMHTTQLIGVTYKLVYYSPAFTATTGQAACTTSNGTWTPG